MLTVKVVNITRPSITFEEIKQPDGTYLPGRSASHAVAFDAKLDPFEHSGQHDQIILEAYDERWQFNGVMLALHPNSKHQPDDLGNYRYILVYSSFRRLPALRPEPTQQGT